MSFKSLLIFTKASKAFEHEFKKPQTTLYLEIIKKSLESFENLQRPYVLVASQLRIIETPRN
jgi:hypothetical protein